MSYRSLLVPVDPHGCAHQVVHHAAQLAAGLGASVTLLHVVQLPPGAHATEVSHGKTAGDLLLDEAHASMAPLVAMLPAGARVVLESGPPVEAILRAIDDLHPDLVVMGTHGRTGLQRLLVGSVAEAVLRGSPVPILIVRAGAGVADEPSTAWRQIDAESQG